MKKINHRPKPNQMSKQTTALNQLLEWVIEFEDRPVRPTLTNMKEKIWQLLPKEREQIEEAFNQADIQQSLTAEQYYSQTYKQQNK